MRMPSSMMRWLLLLGLAGLIGCGADGGVGGTGISSLSGNVALQSSVLERAADLSGIIVGIRGTDLATETDRTGYFEIEGAFEGDVTVEFKELDGTVSALPVPVPSGGRMRLQNVHIGSGAALAERIYVTFLADVGSNAVCDGETGTLEVTDTSGNHVFTIRVDAGTVYDRVSDRCPEAPTCNDLSGDRTKLKISGEQEGTVVQADAILLEKCGNPRSR